MYRKFEQLGKINTAGTINGGFYEVTFFFATVPGVYTIGGVDYDTADNINGLALDSGVVPFGENLSYDPNGNEMYVIVTR